MFNTKVKFIVIFLIYLINISVTQYVNRDSDAVVYESFSPCDDTRVLQLQRVISLPADMQNTYNGSFSFNLWPYVQSPRLTLTLDNPAKLYLTNYNNGAIQVLSNVRKFHILFDQASNEIGTINFWITAPHDADFPNIISVRLDENELCGNAKTWFAAVNNKPDNYHNYGTIHHNQENNNIPNSQIDQQLIQYNKPSTQTRYPWFASIHRITRQRNKFFVCGASILSDSAVITAASCFFGFEDDIETTANPNNFLVEVGWFSRTGTSNLNSYDVKIGHINIHSGYQPYTNEDNNLAVVILTNKIIFNDFIQPVDFWTKSTVLANTLGMAIGWGPKVNSTSLSVTELPVISRKSCIKSNENFYETFLTKNSFCAGYESGSAICAGFGGGGLFFSDGKKWRMRGMVSVAPPNPAGFEQFEQKCFLKNYIVFTDLQPYLAWIKEIIQ